MKRGLVFTLCALAVTATATLGRAQTVDMSLNLRFNDPASPASGGVWYLTAKTSGGATNLGLAGVSVFLENVGANASHGSSVALAAGQNPLHGGVGAGAGRYPTVGQATINNLANAGNPFNGTFGTARNVVYGQDLSIAGIISGIGQGSGAANVAVDPLRNPAFANYAVLLSGTFPGGTTVATLPRFSTAAGQAPQANVLVSTTPGTAAVAATVNAPKVRGDSLGTLNLNSVAGAGLRGGDANRDGTVTSLDFSILSANFNQAGTTWDQGNFNSVTGTNSLDFSILSANFNQSGTPPSVGAVPEPASFTLVGFATLVLGTLAKRRYNNA